MRLVLASICDALAAGIAGFLGFRLALAVTPCSGLADCFPLTPAIVLTVFVALFLYFGPIYIVRRTTPGRLLWRAQSSANTDDELG